MAAVIVGIVTTVFVIYCRQKKISIADLLTLVLLIMMLFYVFAHPTNLFSIAVVVAVLGIWGCIKTSDRPLIFKTRKK